VFTADATGDGGRRPMSSLPVVRIGSLRLYPNEALEVWLRERQHAPIEDLEP